MFKREDWNWIEDLGDNDLLRNQANTSLFAIAAHDNIVVNRIRVASLSANQITTILEYVDKIDNADYSDDAHDSSSFIEELIKQNEIEQYIDNKRI